MKQAAAQTGAIYVYIGALGRDLAMLPAPSASSTTKESPATPATRGCKPWPTVFAAIEKRAAGER